MSSWLLGGGAAPPTSHPPLYSPTPHFCEFLGFFSEGLEQSFCPSSYTPLAVIMPATVLCWQGPMSELRLAPGAAVLGQAEPQAQCPLSPLPTPSSVDSIVTCMYPENKHMHIVGSKQIKFQIKF